MVVSVVVAALLAASSPAGGANAPVARDAPSATKVRCKRELETGTLAKFTKICHTEAEWDAQRGDARRLTRLMQNGVNGQPPD